MRGPAERRGFCLCVELETTAGKRGESHIRFPNG